MNYKVYQGSELKQTVTDKIAVMNGLQPNRTYEFGVEPDNTQTVGGRTRYTHVAYANMTHIANESTSFTLSERATVRFGKDNKWAYKTFDAGTYPAENYTFGGDPYQGVPKVAELVSDFSVGQGSNKTYIGFYTDFIQTDSTNPLDYTWNRNAITSVTTRGIRFNIPKTLTVGSTITLRYEEYPLGIVPIGNEPSGMFGGGNKQNLSAKVISTANGSSVVEVAGNIIEVGNKNLWDTSKVVGGYLPAASGLPNITNSKVDSIIPDPITITSGAKILIMTIYNPNKDVTTNARGKPSFFNESTYLGAQTEFRLTGDTVQTVKWDIPAGATKVYLSSLRGIDDATVSDPSIYIKYEFGDIATPYASFVDGDTFTAQPDGTFALFSEYKALYY